MKRPIVYQSYPYHDAPARRARRPTPKANLRNGNRLRRCWSTGIAWGRGGSWRIGGSASLSWGRSPSAEAETVLASNGGIGYPKVNRTVRFDA